MEKRAFNKITRVRNDADQLSVAAAFKICALGRADNLNGVAVKNAVSRRNNERNHKGFLVGFGNDIAETAFIIMKCSDNSFITHLRNST